MAWGPHTVDARLYATTWYPTCTRLVSDYVRINPHHSHGGPMVVA
ncbi:hypothetical protein MA6G0728R_0506 [Mycobacteroides abscessus 6G-0728-R]|uniref:Uncharacterized protein n=1 Tax=Mycobacteroides abscessus 1948 TaxID=1299323 RepID=A0A829QNP4_9MYCO|nr:hypothetical protein MA6G0125R_4778 [Mycobacteroides abscessus 6G-0125-R]EIU99288.1 hypothetical protein MA6G0212_0572 [Mycobacteroides abscessus 6G-0212]EIV02511.1 hypothetical protein MA6G0728R_0506 [Mycobacteroides abscessus 6G-0728-R]ETZ96178.1 hypothetical protein L828_3325 [Mycobacteroides abscessus MAB_030201_1061]EUA64397.1 hypothetical protein I542_4566 [Mycobacteroides abscessus 1948]